MRVLDLATGPLGSIGRTLGELGADVVRVEPRGGGADRREGLAAGGVALGFVAANLGKRGVALDLTAPADRETFEALAGRADILIEAARPGAIEAAALEGLRERHPALVVLSCRDFGEGPYERWQASDLVLHALSGELSRSGAPGRPPLPPPGELAIHCAAAQGVYGLLAAYLNRRLTGEGDSLELSLLDATTQALDPGYGVAGSATLGTPASQLPRGRPQAGFQYPILPCRDGYARLTVLSTRQWRGMFEWMGRPDELADPAFDDVRHRFASPVLLPRIAAFFADKTRSEIEAEGARHHVPVAGVLTLAEALASEQIRAREAFAEVEIAPGLAAPFPNGVVEIDGARAAPAGAAPGVDADAAAVLRGWSEPRAAATAAPFGAPGRPLAGLRVLDLGVIVVGSEQGRLLADLGAEVIKVENEAFPDGMRVGALDAMSVGFATGQRNKLGLGLNLRAPEGRELFLRLAARSDVILSNFKPGTMASLGLGDDVLLGRNPGLILVESSAFGATGPWRGRLGYGPLVRASAGLTEQWRYPDEAASFTDATTVYPDHVAARVGASAVLALLIRRQATGRGGTAGVSQTEVMLGHMAEEIAAAALRRKGVRLEGLDGRDAPWGVFPCAGDDAWCVVTVRGDADWAALAPSIDRPDLGGDAGLASAQGRSARRAELDAALANWLAARDPHEAAAALQAAGVPAAPMLRVCELPTDPHFEARGLFETLVQPGLDEPIVVDNAPIRSQHLARPRLSPAPRLGEHTRQIARELLDLSDADIDRLLAAKVLEAPAGA